MSISLEFQGRMRKTAAVVISAIFLGNTIITPGYASGNNLRPVAVKQSDSRLQRLGKDLGAGIPDISADVAVVEAKNNPGAVARRLNALLRSHQKNIMALLGEKPADLNDRLEKIINEVNAQGSLQKIRDVNVAPISYVEDHQRRQFAKQDLIKGKLMLQMPFAGAGSRMDKSLTAFGIKLPPEEIRLANIDIWNIAQKMGSIVYEQAVQNGKTDAEARELVKKEGLILEIPSHAKHIGFAEREMLALEQSILNLERDYGFTREEVGQVRKNLKLVISVSDEIFENTNRMFSEPSKLSGKSFFGFDPKNVVFVMGGYGPGFGYDEQGELKPNTSKDSWNHGYAFIELAWLKGPFAYTLTDRDARTGRAAPEYLRDSVFQYALNRGATSGCIHRINDLILMHPRTAIDVEMFNAFLNLKKLPGNENINMYLEMMANPTNQKGGLALTEDGKHLILFEGLATKDKLIDEKINRLANAEMEKTAGQRGVPYNRLYGYYDIESLVKALASDDMPLLIKQKSGVLSPEIPTGDATWLEGIEALAGVRKTDWLIKDGILPNEQRDPNNNTIYEKDGITPKQAWSGANGGSGSMIHDCKEAKYIKDGLLVVEAMDNPASGFFAPEYYTRDGGAANSRDLARELYKKLRGGGSLALEDRGALIKAYEQDQWDEVAIDNLINGWPVTEAQVAGPRLKFSPAKKELFFPGVTVISHHSARRYELFRALISTINEDGSGGKYLSTVAPGSEHITLYDLVSAGKDWEEKLGVVRQDAFVDEKNNIDAAGSEALWMELRAAGIIDQWGFILDRGFYTKNIDPHAKAILITLLEKKKQIRDDVALVIRNKAELLVRQYHMGLQNALQQAAFQVVAESAAEAIEELDRAGFKTPVFVPYKIAVMSRFGPSILILNMKPKTAEDLIMVYALQDKIMERTGIKNYYTFKAHVSLGYIINPVEKNDEVLFNRLIRELQERVDASKEEFELPQIELCYFAGMNKFAPIEQYDWTKTKTVSKERVGIDLLTRQILEDARINKDGGAQGKLVLYSGPSAVGKSPLWEQLKRLYPDSFARIVLYTSRSMRPGEQEGVDYKFRAPDQIRQLAKDAPDLFATMMVQSDIQGLDLRDVDAAVKSGKTAIAEVSVDWADYLKKQYPDKIYSIFISPLTDEEIALRAGTSGINADQVIYEEMKERQDERNPEKPTAPEKREVRAKNAIDEMSRRSSYDKVIINSDLRDIKAHAERWNGPEGGKLADEFVASFNSHNVAVPDSAMFSRDAAGFDSVVDELVNIKNIQGAIVVGAHTILENAGSLTSLMKVKESGANIKIAVWSDDAGIMDGLKAMGIDAVADITSSMGARDVLRQLRSAKISAPRIVMLHSDIDQANFMDGFTYNDDVYKEFGRLKIVRVSTGVITKDQKARLNSMPLAVLRAVAAIYNDQETVKQKFNAFVKRYLDGQKISSDDFQALTDLAKDIIDVPLITVEEEVVKIQNAYEEALIRI